MFPTASMSIKIVGTALGITLALLVLQGATRPAQSDLSSFFEVGKVYAVCWYQPPFEHEMKKEYVWNTANCHSFSKFAVIGKRNGWLQVSVHVYQGGPATPSLIASLNPSGIALAVETNK